MGAVRFEGLKPRPLHNKRHNITIWIFAQQTPYRVYTLVFHTALPPRLARLPESVEISTGRTPSPPYQASRVSRTLDGQALSRVIASLASPPPVETTKENMFISQPISRSRDATARPTDPISIGESILVQQIHSSPSPDHCTGLTQTEHETFKHHADHDLDHLDLVFAVMR